MLGEIVAHWQPSPSLRSGFRSLPCPALVAFASLEIARKFYATDAQFKISSRFQIAFVTPASARWIDLPEPVDLQHLVRPHSALGMLTPEEFAASSQRFEAANKWRMIVVLTKFIS